MGWLIGKALSPFLALLMCWAITRPASRWLAADMREGPVKRLLLLNSERNPVAYSICGALFMVFVVTVGIWLTGP